MYLNGTTDRSYYKDHPCNINGYVVVKTKSGEKKFHFDNNTAKDALIRENRTVGEEMYLIFPSHMDSKFVQRLADEVEKSVPFKYPTI